MQPLREGPQRILAALRARAVPAARIAADQRYREADIALDFCEDVPRLPEQEIERITALMRAA